MICHFTILLELGLCLFSILSTMILTMCWRRHSGMVKDTASLSNVLELTTSEESLTSGRRLQRYSGKRYSAFLRRGKLILRPTSSLCSLDPNDVTQGAKSSKRKSSSAMNIFVRVTLISVLLVALLIVLMVSMLSYKRKSLELPSNNSALNQIVLNYVPITFATLLEPV